MGKTKIVKVPCAFSPSTYGECELEVETDDLFCLKFGFRHGDRVQDLRIGNTGKVEGVAPRKDAYELRLWISEWSNLPNQQDLALSIGMDEICNFKKV
jgi:hypothetical protein